jgi:hypothetical protein
VTVYVDDLSSSQMQGHDRWCHMLADTHEELTVMAARLKLRPEWIQNKGSTTEHYDLTASVRKRAVNFGAREITSTEVAGILEGKKLELIVYHPNGTWMRLSFAKSATVGDVTREAAEALKYSASFPILGLGGHAAAHPKITVGAAFEDGDQVYLGRLEYVPAAMAKEEGL